MLIRPARPSEAPAICRLEDEVWGSATTLVQDISIFIRFGKVLVAEDVKGDLIGVIYAIHTADGFLVEDWVVHPKHQGRGVGQALYEEFLCGVDRPVEALVEVGNEVSRAVHSKLGFVDVGLIPDALCLDTDFTLVRRPAP